MLKKSSSTAAVALCAFGLLYFPVTASAFKVDTHVWVGQQVLNDVVDDGKVTILMNGRPHDFPVTPAVADAIKANPSIYRMGNIGPDAFPDMLTGQMVVHPGVVGAWRTDDWLRFLLSQAKTPEQLAFAYGYLGHVSADTWAHTYVNQYAGDIFELSDGEIDVELRHTALESYIANFTPSLQDAQGNYLGEAHSVLAQPASFLRDTFILNDTAAEQNLKGKMLHLSLVHELRKALDSTHPIMTDIDIVVTQKVVQYYTKIKLNQDQAQRVYDAAQTVHQWIAANNGVDSIQAAKNTLSAAIEDAVGYQADIQNRLTNAMTDLWSAKSRRDQAILDFGNKSLELANTANQICRLIPVPQKPCPGCSKWIPGSCAIRRACQAENAQMQNICDLNPAYVALQTTVAALQLAKDTSDRVFLSSQDGLRAATTFAHDASIAIIQADTAAFNGLIDSVQKLTSDLNPVRAHIDGWIQDIDNGMEAYIVANGEVIKALMKHEPALKPIQDWTDCWAFAVTGVLLGPANNALCTVQERLKDVQTAMATFETSLLKINPLGNLWVNFQDQITVLATQKANDLAWEYANTITGVNAKQIIDIFGKQMDAKVLNNTFAVDGSTKGLLLIPDIAARVDQEMYQVAVPAIGTLGARTVFDQKRYAVAYNAVTLAKLALLTPDQLNQLAIAAGVQPSLATYVNGSPLYNNTGTPSNLLVDAIGSIDGNHAWMPFAPPYPRRIGMEYTNKPDLDRSYGYDAAVDVEKGFRLFQGEGARAKMFDKIFLGPLVPGLETPNLLGLSALLPTTYPYLVCDANHYPNYPATASDLVSCPPDTQKPVVTGDTVWMDDAVPTGTSEGSMWWWYSSAEKVPYSGSRSHGYPCCFYQAAHEFGWASPPLQLNAGDSLYAYVYIEPADPASEIMLQFQDATGWEHRAYWGANAIAWGADGTSARRYMGPMPQSGTWVRLEVPAALVGLEGAAIMGMSFVKEGGTVIWDQVGKSAP